MARFIRAATRIVVTILLAVLLVSTAVLLWFTHWRTEKIRTLDNGSEIINTLYGDVECAVKGEGPCVLVFHGTPGGYDQALLLADGLAEKGFQVVAPSRPGYLRTPLSSGILPEQQADLMAALLDVLGVENATAIGVGGGAAAAVEFVERHPKKATGLLLISPTLATYNYTKIGIITQPGVEVPARLTGDVGSWIATKWVDREPRAFLRDVLKWTSSADYDQRAKVENAVLADPAQVAWFQALVGTFAPTWIRGVGARNDLVCERAMPDFAWAKLTAPTLVVAGAADPTAEFAVTQKAIGQIPGAKLEVVDGAGFLVPLGPWWASQREEVIGFLRECAKNPPAS